MIILDTNVVSEVMRARPASAVLTWLAAQASLDAFTTSITRAEVFFGVERRPEGGRRQRLGDAARIVFDRDFRDRVLPFDDDAAAHYAPISAARERLGRRIAQFDAQIAAIARLRGASLATRNVVDFRDCGIDIIDPWSA